MQAVIDGFGSRQNMTGKESQLMNQLENKKWVPGVDFYDGSTQVHGVSPNWRAIGWCIEPINLKHRGIIKQGTVLIYRKRTESTTHKKKIKNAHATVDDAALSYWVASYWRIMCCTTQKETRILFVLDGSQSM